MTTEPEPTNVETAAPVEVPMTTEERLRHRLSMLNQLLILAAMVVVLQFGIMLKVLLDK